MNSYRVLRREEHEEMPWLNGGGSTLQVMTSPVGAEMDGFDWRVSCARIESSGPFSSLPGVDRVLTLVEGVGARLTLSAGAGAGARSVTLTRHEPFAFAGEEEVGCEAAGPSTVLNLMTRRGRCTGEVKVHLVGAAVLTVAPVPGDELLLVVLDGAVEVRAEGEPPATPVRLEPLDVIVDLTRPVALAGGGVVALVRVQQTGMTPDPARERGGFTLDVGFDFLSETPPVRMPIR